MKNSTATWSAWLQLIRPPNLPTVPGDPIVGLLLSATGSVSVWPQLAGPVSAAVLLYAGGLVLNDWGDADEDSCDRPDRPIPSGRVGRSLAGALAVFLLAAGIALSMAVSLRCGAVALVLAAAIVFYNLVAKPVPVLGLLVMGACRGLSVLLGWGASGSALPSISVLSAAALIAAYIVAVSAVAVNETRGGPVGFRRWGVPLVALAAVAAAGAHGLSSVGVGVGCVVVAHALLYAVHLGRALEPPQVAAAVGGLIRGVILLQLLFCLERGAAGAACAVALLVLHVLSSLLGHRFYGS